MRNLFLYFILLFIAIGCQEQEKEVSLVETQFNFSHSYSVSTTVDPTDDEIHRIRNIDVTLDIADDLDPDLGKIKEINVDKVEYSITEFQHCNFIGCTRLLNLNICPQLPSPAVNVCLLGFCEIVQDDYTDIIDYSTEALKAMGESLEKTKRLMLKPDFTFYNEPATISITIKIYTTIVSEEK